VKKNASHIAVMGFASFLQQLALAFLTASKQMQSEERGVVRPPDATHA
jgi:hypothetical protein